MKRKMGMLAVLITAAGLAACAPRADESTREPVSIEETAGETADESGKESEAPEGSTEAATEGMTDGTETPGNGAEPGGGESGDAAVSADQKLNEIHEAVRKAYGDNYIPNMPYDETALEEVFGVKKEWYDAFIAEGPMISVHVETFIGVKAKEGKAADVKAALETYRKAQIEGSMQYPMNMPKLEASQVLEHGDYVFFVMLGSPAEDAETQGEEEALASAKENNQIGIDAVDGFFNRE